MSYNGDFDLFTFYAIMTVFIWGRLLVMLQLNRVFGPMLRIIFSMFGQVSKFLLIYIVTLICQTSVASLLFGEIEQYSSFVDVFFIMFETGLSALETDTFENYSGNQVFASFFLLSCVLINTIVLINFVIAILADTYSKLSIESLGIYYDKVISRIPFYENDRRYGGLITCLPPFNVFALFMLPAYYFIKDERQLITLNDWFTRIIFFPAGIFNTVVFTAINLALLPFAYIGAIYQKLSLLRGSQKHLNPDLKPLVQD